MKYKGAGAQVAYLHLLGFLTYNNEEIFSNVGDCHAGGMYRGRTLGKGR